MKTRRIVPLIALAALVTACAAPIQAPILQQPKTETATLPFELPAAPVEKTAPEIPDFEVPVAPVPVPQTLPPWSWSQEEGVAQQRLEAQAELYRQGYRPPNGQLTIGRTDPSAYPAEVEAVVNAPYIGRTDPSAYPAEVEAVMAPAPVQMYPADELRDFGQIRGAEEQKYSQPIQMYPPDELRDFGQIRGAEEQKYSQPLPAPVLYQSSYDQTDPSAYPAEVEAVVNAPYIGRTDPSAYPAEIEAVVNAPYIGHTDPSAYPAEIETVVHAPYIGQTDPSAYPADIQAIAAP